MTATPINNNLCFFLPALNQEADVKAIDEAGKWEEQENNAFEKVATSLNYQAPREVKSISSVPTMWARPLSVEMALHNNQYPIRDQMIEQWRGMLAALALAEVRGFPLKAQLIELRQLRYEEFARCLHELLPSESRTLYTIANKHSWEDIYVFLWQGKAVGMTSPSTLVCPAEEGEWTGLQWWVKGQLRSPIPHLNASEKSLLWRWLENLRREIGKPEYQGKKQAINTIGGLIDEFRADLNADTSQPLSLTEEPQFFGVPLNRGILNTLNFPVKAPEKPSNIRLIASSSKNPKSDLLVIDPEIAKVWNVPSQNIWVHGGKTLASLNVEELRQRIIIWQDVKWVEPKDLFLPEFKFINQEDALPGAFLPKEVVPLTFEGDRITPLIPLNPILLDYLTVINGRQINWNSRLQLEEDEEEIQQFTIPQLVQLPKFIYDFHVALRELEIEGIKPLPGYKRSLDLQENEKLWRDTNRALTDVLLKIKGSSENIRFEPPYILGLKALLRVLGKDWAEKWSK